MEITLRDGITVKSKDRTREFAAAVEYLLQTFPPAIPVKFLTVHFKKGDTVCVSRSFGDYKSGIEADYLDSQIQVAYGKNGTQKRVWHTLFHEYKHLLQDSEGLFSLDDTKNLNHCIEANAWADEQVPIYLAKQQEVPHVA